MQPVIGTTFDGRYRLERQLGAGASATVWLAFDSVLERRVAIKVLADALRAAPDKRERFRREARALAKLGHPHIVTVIGTGEDDGAAFIVLEYIGGETLKQRIRRAGRLPVDEAVAYAIEVARALAAAHERGIVHRDVKSQNILLDPDGGAKLTDFGIARSGAEVALTQGGRVLGTTDYVAPEQALGHEATGQSDLYSLGVVLYEALTGAVPFAGTSQLAVAKMHVREQFPDVQRARPEVSAALAAVLDRATAKHVERRYPDARAMIGDLERALAIETARSGGIGDEASVVLRTLPEAARSRVPLSVRHPSSTVLAAVVVVLVAGAVAAFALAHVHRDPPVRATPTFVEQPVSLAGASATSYNPFGTGSPDNPGLAARAIDGRPGSAWMTNRYVDGLLGKAGVGIYVTLRAASAANRLEFQTSTPGFHAQVWGASAIRTYRAGGAQALAALGWHWLGGAPRAGTTVAINLGDPRTAYRHYLVWITHLEPVADGNAANAAVAAISLSQAVRR
jgi:serine/threonine-protein kinase